MHKLICKKSHIVSPLNYYFKPILDYTEICLIFFLFFSSKNVFGEVCVNSHFGILAKASKKKVLVQLARSHQVNNMTLKQVIY